MTVLVLGDVLADVCGEVSSFPREGDDVALRSLGWRSGGMGANVAAALARLGARALLLGRVGRDPAADVALRAARDAGADLSAVQVDPSLATGLCFAVVSEGGERTFFSYRGASAAFRLETSPLDALDALGARWVHVCGHALLEGTQRAAALGLLDAALERGVPASLDLCPPLLRAARSEVLALLPKLRVLFANESEMLLLCPRAPDALDALDALAPEPSTMIALKRGARGCVVRRGGALHASPPFVVHAVNTTGSGDAFVAGFLEASLRGAPLEERARQANALGALAATRRGAADALPTHDELRAFLSERGAVRVDGADEA